MKTFKNDSIETIITDPPYGIGFIGKEWDVWFATFAGAVVGDFFHVIFQVLKS